MPLIEGQVLEGKYEIVRLLARGGMGDVYLGTHRRIAKPVAIKVLSSDLVSEPAAVERFEREARVATRIRSAHIAETYDLGDLASGERFIVMELLEGETLGARLDRERRIAERALASIALQILDALASAHEAGVVHRDLKPDNLFLTKRDGRDFVKVVDFGVSKVLESETDCTLTVAGALVGTPAYMSPEQARGMGIDHRTDLYALGVVLYEATVGEPPFVAETLNDMLFRIALDTPAPLETRVPSVTGELSAIVQKAMAKAPNDRYRTAAEMRDDVLAWQEACGPAPGARASNRSIPVGPRVADVSMQTPRPWSIPTDDADDDADERLVPQRRPAGWLVAMAMFACLIALGAMRPRELRAMSDEITARAAVLRGAETNMTGASPPASPPAAITIVTTDLLPPRSAEPIADAPPSPPRTVATTNAPPAVAPRATPSKQLPKAEAKATSPTAEPSAAQPPPQAREDTIF